MKRIAIAVLAFGVWAGSAARAGCPGAIEDAEGKIELRHRNGDGQRRKGPGTRCGSRALLRGA